MGHGHDIYWGSEPAVRTAHAVVTSLRKAIPRTPGLDGRFRSALVALVRLQDRQALDGSLNVEQREAFRIELSEALTPFAEDLALYVEHIEFTIEVANEENDDWFKGCQARSAVQILLEQFSDHDAVRRIDTAALAAIDDQMREVGASLGPIPEVAIPNGLPPSHWWWSFPDNVDG